MNRIRTFRRRTCPDSSFSSSKTSCFLRTLALALALCLWHAPLYVVEAGPLHLQCDPCIDRSKLEIHAIVHGTINDPEWVQAQKAMKQASDDMGINLQMTLRETFSSKEMAKEIRDLIRYKVDNSEHGHTHNVRQIDGLIVTVPDEIVRAAVEDAIQANIHVFGFNMGYELVRNDVSILGYVAQDEYWAGKFAAEEFGRRRLGRYGPPKNAIFINHNKDDPALQERFRGFNSALYDEYGILAEELIVDPNNFYDMIIQVDDRMQFCKYDFVLLGGTETVPAVTAAAQHHLCNDYFTEMEQQVVANFTASGLGIKEKPSLMIGAFDDTTEIFDAIVAQTIEFTLSPQKYIQSALPVLFSTIYASTGQRPSLPFEGMIYTSGPHVIDIENLPSDAYMRCQDEAFPVCPRDGSPVDSLCPCIDRKQLRLAGVVHGVQGSKFWDDVFSAAHQAAVDMGVTLELDRFEPQESDEVLHDKMAAKIMAYCGSGVDGIVISMPSEVLMRAVRFCKQLRVPVINVNSGMNFARELNVQHIGQLEYVAGYRAGERMVLSDLQIGFCTIHESGNIALLERCNGFRDFVVESNRTFGGIIQVPRDNVSQFTKAVEDAVNDPTGNWDGVGLLLTGYFEQTHTLQQKHQSVMLATFDVFETLFAPLDDGRLLFTIDQQQRLQGSLAVYMLAYGTYTKQFLLNAAIETGPHIVEYSPSPAEQKCRELNYPVCSQVPEEDYNFIASYWLAIGYTAVAITLFTGLLCLIWMHVYRKKKIVKASQPLFLGFLVCGVFISTLAILPLGVETEYRYVQDPMTGELTDQPNPDITFVDTCCMLTNWLTGMGFAIIFSALCAKIRRVKMIYDNGAAMRRKKVEAKDVLVIMAGISAIEITILLCWTFIAPSQWHREPVLIVDGYVLESTGRCHGGDSNIFLLTQFLFHAACLFYALVLSWQTSKIPTEFAEGTHISLSILCIFQVYVVAIPVGYMVEGDPDAFFFVRSAALFLTTYTVLCFIFFPKIWRVFSGNDVLPISVVAGRGSSVPPTLSNNYSSGYNTTYGQQHITASSSLPGVDSTHNRDTAPSSPPFSSRAGVAFSKEGVASNKGGPRDAPFVQKMASLDSDSDDDLDPKLPVSPKEPYNQLKAGLDAEESSSSSSSELNELPNSDAQVIANNELTSLAAEISRAEQTRENGYTSLVGENAPTREHGLQSTNPRSAPESLSNELPDTDANTGNTKKRSMKRRGSPDIDSSPDSSSNTNGYDPMTHANAALQEALRPFKSQNSADYSDESDESSTSSSESVEADDGKNPQEGGSHVSNDISNDSKNSKDNLMKFAVSGTDNSSGNIESESTSTTAASTAGITRAEASMAEIFRKANIDEKPHATPIRLKKDPQAYGENAALAEGITKASGSFLRKVAASFGSVSVSSTMTHPQLSEENKSTLRLQSPPRLRQDTEQKFAMGTGFAVPAYSHSTTLTAKATDRDLSSREFFQVDRRDRPQYAALKRSINDDDEKTDGRAALVKNLDNEVEKNVQPKLSEAEALYFL